MLAEFHNCVKRMDADIYWLCMMHMWTKEISCLGPLGKMNALESSYTALNPSPRMS